MCMPSNHLIICCLLLPLPSIFPSIRVFPKESALHISWPKYWSFNFSNRPSNEYSSLIFFRIDWLDLLVVQVTLKSLLQHHSSKASILWQSLRWVLKQYAWYPDEKRESWTQTQKQRTACESTDTEGRRPHEYK